MSKATSFRLSDHAHDLLRMQAEREGRSIREVLEDLIVEGVVARRHPGIVHRGRPGDRRAALAAGPDVWEVIDAIRWATGDPEQQINGVASNMGLHPRQVRIAVEYAAAHSDEIDQLIAENDAAAEQAQAAAEARGKYLAS